MKRIFVVAACVVSFAAGGLVTAAWQGAQASTTRRVPQFDNEHVRVWKSIIQPHQPLAMHRHEHGRTLVALRGGALKVVRPDGTTVKTMDWKTGSAYWLDADPPGEVHGDLNDTTEPIEVMVVEMKR